MSISLEGKGWRCWRTANHRGKSPTRLVAALLNCSLERAAQLTGTASFRPVDDLHAEVTKLFQPQTIERKAYNHLPLEFKQFDDRLPSSWPYLSYLENRGFKGDLPFRLYYATQGDFAGRIIFPVVVNKQLMGWTARTISKNQSLRYKAEGKITDYLLWQDNLNTTKAQTLVLVEGPFDAAKVRYLGNREGITATCFFTSSPSQSQISYLNDILPRFKRCVILLDRGTLANAMMVLRSLPQHRVTFGQLDGFKDPGDLKTLDQLLRCVNVP
jgi:hypothetical protein